jgi:2,3,4,5-tetrahydropyridine-2-carboxylate N-succinyltransferase
MDAIKTIIEQAFENNAEITPRTAPTHLKDAVYEAIERLDSGRARVAEKKDDAWVVNDWLNTAIVTLFPN